MTKILKFSAIIISTLILLLVLGLGLLAAFVSPNKLKPIITAQVLKYTGRQLTIDGDLSWSFFPYLGVKVGHMMLNNPAGFKENTFAEIDHATVSVNVLPLLHAKIETSGITLSGVKLNLIKNADGQTNWQDLLAPQQTADKAPRTTEVAQTPTDKKVSMSLEIPSVDVNNSQIKWNDEKANQSADIDQFEFHATDINLAHVFPVKTSFHFAAKNPTVSGQVTLAGQIQLDLDQQVYQVMNMDLALNVQQNNKNIPIALKGDLIANLQQQTIKLNGMKTTIANLVLSGNLNVTDLNAKPIVSAHVESQPFDLKQFLQSLGQNVTALQTAKDVVADVDVSMNTAEKSTTATPFAALQGVKMQGHIKMSEVETAKIKVTNVVVDTQLNNNVLQIMPLSASLYQGDVQGQAKVNLTTAVPQFALKGKLANVQAEPLLQDLSSQPSKLKIKGAGNVALDITTSGMEVNTILQNLNGSTQFSFKDGQLDGINIGNLIDSAYALVKHNPMPENKEDVTNFGMLTGSAEIHNGVATNKDLFVDSPQFSAAGQGSIDLVKQQINYQLELMPKQKDKTDKNPLSDSHFAIPVQVTGNFNSPSIHLNTDAIIEMVAKQQVNRAQDKIKQQIQDKIKGQLPGQAGALIQNLLGN